MLNKEDLRIAISGHSGCGNTTISTLLSQRFGLTLVNYTFRSIAQEDGITFDTVCHRAETSDADDLRVDKTQLKLARKNPSIMGSRLAIWLLEEAQLKIFLTASPEIRARRIMEREGGELQEHIIRTKTRDQQDHDRYQRLYRIDNDNYQHADLIINTGRLGIYQVTDIIAMTVEALFQKRKEPVE